MRRFEMSIRKLLIDTNIVIGLEDYRTVQPALAALVRLAAKHHVDILVHEASRDDIRRDRDVARRQISMSKLEKFQLLPRVRGLSEQKLISDYGPLPTPNDKVDAQLLHALEVGAVDFLVTQDRPLHSRARRRASELGRRVLYVDDATDLLNTTFEPSPSPVKYVEEVEAHTISLQEGIFDGLRKDYPKFDEWWKEKCVREHRKCWVVYDGCVAGLVVRKHESEGDTDATGAAERILKVCTFKVSDQNRGLKLGELLLKQVLWFAQANVYDLVYLTVYRQHIELIDLLEFYGFVHTASKKDGECIYEKVMSPTQLETSDDDVFRVARLNYPGFVIGFGVKAYYVPIQEQYHDTLFPDLRDARQGNLFEDAGITLAPRRPGNTIRKVYLCRAQTKLDLSGSLLFFYKSKSESPPSQSFTAVGVFEESAKAKSTTELARLAGGRSVYSEAQLAQWGASANNPVTVINFLLVGYIVPPIEKVELEAMGIIGSQPPQSISLIDDERLDVLLEQLKLGFDIKSN